MYSHGNEPLLLWFGQHSQVTLAGYPNLLGWATAKHRAVWDTSIKFDDKHSAALSRLQAPSRLLLVEDVVCYVRLPKLKALCLDNNNATLVIVFKLTVLQYTVWCVGKSSRGQPCCLMAATAGFGGKSSFIKVLLHLNGQLSLCVCYTGLILFQRL